MTARVGRCMHAPSALPPSRTSAYMRHMARALIFSFALSVLAGCLIMFLRGIE